MGEEREENGTLIDHGFEKVGSKFEETWKTWFSKPMSVLELLPFTYTALPLAFTRLRTKLLGRLSRLAYKSAEPSPLDLLRSMLPFPRKFSSHQSSSRSRQSLSSLSTIPLTSSTTISAASFSSLALYFSNTSSKLLVHG